MTAAALVAAALVLWAAAVAWIDWRQRRIPNGLLLALLLPALVLLAWRGQGLLEERWVSSAVGLAVGLAVTLPGYAVAKLAAGDVKLAAVTGLVLGWPLTAWSLLAAGVVLALMSVGALLLWGFAGSRQRQVRLPAGVAFAGGFAAVVLLRLFSVGGVR